MHRPPAGPAAAQLRVAVNGRMLVLPTDRPLTVGRDPASAVVVDDPRVSRQHAVLHATPAGLWWADASSAGSFVGMERITQVQITDRIAIRLGDPHNGPLVEVWLEAAPAGWAPAPPVAPAAPRAPVGPSVPAGPPGYLGDPRMSQGLGTFIVSQPVGRRLRIGRSPENDIVIGDDLTVSRRHAEIVEDPAGVRLVDLGGAGGTYLNGHRVTEARLEQGSLIGLGRRVFVYSGGMLHEYVDDRGGIAVRGLTVTVGGGRRLLDDVNFAVQPGQVLAVLGTTGAGKSTLLRALTGFSPATAGTVSYGDRDLYSSLDELRRRIGYVPQDDILHTQLTVRQALRFASELRFAGDVSRAERDARVGEVLHELGLTGCADRSIALASGGQRKRASVAAELLTRPARLFLDEPTSGLDPGYERSVMELLRELADGGRTIVVITHSVASLDLCDRVLFLAPGGRMAYFGPPKGVLPYFGDSNHADVFRRLDSGPERDWTGELRASPDWQRHVAPGLVEPPVQQARPPARSAAAAVTPLTQLTTLARRTVAVLGRSRSQSILMLAQAPLVALLLFAALQTGNLDRESDNPHSRQLLMLLIVGSVAMGLVNACREVVKELPILRRERAVGLSLSAYLGSKLLCLGILGMLQSIVLVVGVVSFQGKLEYVPELLPAVVLANLAAMTLGLALSATVASEATALILVPVLIVAQLVLSNSLFTTESRPVLGQIGWATPAYWGFRTSASVVDLNALDQQCIRRAEGQGGGDAPCSPHWNRDVKNLAAGAGGSAALALVYAGLAYVALRRR